MPLLISQVARNIRNVAHRFGKIICFKAYLDVADSTPKTIALRSELQSSGVSVIFNGSKDVADQMIVVDMLVHAMDHPRTTFIVISGDRDFAYPVSILRLRKCEVTVISISTHGSLTSQASVWLDWNKHVLGLTPADSRSGTTSSSSTTSQANLDAATSPTTTQFEQFKSPASYSEAPPPMPLPQAGPAPAYTTDSRLEPLTHDDEEELATEPPLQEFATHMEFHPPVRPLSPAVVDHRPDFPVSPPSVIRTQSLNAPSSSFFPAPPEFPSASLVEELTPKNFPAAVLLPSPPLASGSAIRISTSTSSSKSAFEPLIEVLEAHKANGFPRPLRSIIGQELVKSVYERAGTQSFAQYTALAEKKGLIQTGGAQGFAWISLKPSLQSTTASSAMAGYIPVIFQPLVDAIMRHRARGVLKPSCSVVGSQIGGQSVYTAAGVKKFRQYILLAEQAKIVQMGGQQGEEWIALHSSLVS
ncbi:NYN domain-containing protein [Mycena amicta]|nr:NYN domain-containing protein [Mycena amicta]